MKIINRYICWNLLTTLALAIVVLSFILVVGSFAKLSGLLAQGVSVIPLLQLVLLKLPQILGYTIPFGLLLSTILLFNRMSVDDALHELGRPPGSELMMMDPSDGAPM